MKKIMNEKLQVDHLKNPVLLLAHPDDEALFFGALNCLC